MSGSSKIALFNSVKGNYSQKGFQPDYELETVVKAQRSAKTKEVIERKEAFKGRRRSKKSDFVLGGTHKFVSEDGFVMGLPTSILSAIPEKEDRLKPSQLRAKRHAETRSNFKK